MITPEQLLQHARSYTLSEEVFGARLGPEALPKLLAPIDVRNGLVSLAKLAWVLEDSGPLSQSVQIQIASRILSPVPLGRAKALLAREPQRILFFRPQIHATMKYLCLHGQYNDPPKPVLQSEIQKIAVALFAATDLIAAESIRRQKALAGEDAETRIAFQLVLGEHLVKTPNFLNDFVRTKAIYQTLHQTKEARLHPDFIDLDDVFIAATKLSLVEYMEVGLGLILNFLRFRSRPDLVKTDRDFILFHPRTWLSKSNLPHEKVHAAIILSEQAPTDIAVSTASQTSRERAHDHLDLRLRPLITLGTDTDVPVSFDFVAEKLSTGLYWSLFDILREVGPGDQHLKFSRYHGYLFERYVGDVSSAIVQQHPAIYEAPIIDAIYHVGKNQKKTCDVLLIASDHIIAIEVTASRLTAKRTVALGIREAFIADCKKVVFDKAHELATFIRDLLEGRVTVEGRAILPAGRKVFPVLVSLEGFPRILPIDEYLYAEMDHQATFSGLAVQPLSLLTIEEWESIARFPPTSLLQLLNRWQSDSRFPHVTLADFRSDSTVEAAGRSSPWFEAKFTSILDDAAQTILGKSIESILATDRSNTSADTSGA